MVVGFREINLINYDFSCRAVETSHCCILYPAEIVFARLSCSSKLFIVEFQTVHTFEDITLHIVHDCDGQSPDVLLPGGSCFKARFVL